MKHLDHFHPSNVICQWMNKDFSAYKVHTKPKTGFKRFSAHLFSCISHNSFEIFYLCFICLTFNPCCPVHSRKSLKGLHKTFLGSTKKCEKKKFKLVIFFRPGSLYFFLSRVNTFNRKHAISQILKWLKNIIWKSSHFYSGSGVLWIFKLALKDFIKTLSNFYKFSDIVRCLLSSVFCRYLLKLYKVKVTVQASAYEACDHTRTPLHTL